MIDLNNPDSVHAALNERCPEASAKLVATSKRIAELKNITDPAVKADQIESLVLGMLMGVLGNQVVIMAALTNLMDESADRRQARIELARGSGLSSIVGGRMR
jgi:hypothetical protein